MEPISGRATLSAQRHFGWRTTPVCGQLPEAMAGIAGMECGGLASKASGGLAGLVGGTALPASAFYGAEQPVFDFG